MDNGRPFVDFTSFILWITLPKPVDNYKCSLWITFFHPFFSPLIFTFFHKMGNSLHIFFQKFFFWAYAQFYFWLNLCPLFPQVSFSISSPCHLSHKINKGRRMAFPFVRYLPKVAKPQNRPSTPYLTLYFYLILYGP